MLNVNYTEKIGFYYENNHQIWLCGANALWAEMYFYQKDDGTEMAQLCGFAADIQHLKNMLKNDRYHNNTRFTFYAEWLKKNKQIWQAIKELVKAKKDIDIINMPF